MYPKAELGHGIPSLPGAGPCPTLFLLVEHQSLQATSAAQKASARVADPESASCTLPSGGDSSPQPTYQQGAVEASSGQDSESGSPALGTAWKPMKTSSEEAPCPLEKELREVFETEAPKSNLPSEPVLPLEAPSSSELDVPLGTQFSLEDQMPPWSQTELPSTQVFSEEETGQLSETLMTSQGSHKPLRDPETP